MENVCSETSVRMPDKTTVMAALDTARRAASIQPEHFVLFFASALSELESHNDNVTVSEKEAKLFTLHLQKHHRAIHTSVSTAIVKAIHRALRAAPTETWS